MEQRVATGRYQTASEVIREGLRLLEHREKDREAAYKSLKSKLKRASAQADRGEFVTPNDVHKQIGELKRKRRAART